MCTPVSTASTTSLFSNALSFTTFNFLLCSSYCGCTCSTLSLKSCLRLLHRHQRFRILQSDELHESLIHPMRCCDCTAAASIFLSFVRQVVVDHISGQTCGVGRGFNFSAGPGFPASGIGNVQRHFILFGSLPSMCECEHTHRRASCCLC